MRHLLTLLAVVGLVHVGLGTTIDFTDETITSINGKDWTGYTDDLSTWTNYTSKACKARATGIGIASASNKDGTGASAMLCTFTDAQPMTQLKITVVASTSTAAKASKLVLGVTLNDGDIATQTFSFGGETNTSQTFLFAYDEVQSVSTLVISNESSYASSYIYEVQSVEWSSSFDPITVETQLSSTVVSCGTTFYPTLVSISGGTGVYSSITWTFNGASYSIDASDYANVATSLVAPDEEGSFDLTLTIEDSAGNVGTFTYPITVSSAAALTNLVASDITLSGFTLSWDLGSSLIPTSYKATVQEVPTSLSIPFAPHWTQTSEGVWESDDVSLFAYTAGRATKSGSYLRYSTTGATISYSTDAGANWTSATQVETELPVDVPYYTFAMAEGDDQRLRLRVESTTLPDAFTIVYLCEVYSETVEVTSASQGQGHTATFTDLPKGRTYKVSLIATFADDLGSYTSAPLTVSLQSIPTFESVTLIPMTNTLTFGWPTTDETYTPCVKLWYRKIRAHTLPEGLYLSRVYYTLSGTDRELCKAIVLTNTSLADISLKGYTLTRTYTGSDGTEKSVAWDFSTTADGTTTYPTVPASDEVMLYCTSSSGNAPQQALENLIATNKSALNFTDASTLTLSYSGTAINSLTPVKNALVVLEEDSISSTETYTVTSSAQPPSKLTYHWSNLIEDVYHTTLHPAILGQIRLRYYIEDYAPERTYSLWAECYTKMDSTYSPIQTATLWTVGDTTGLLNGGNVSNETKPGYILRLR